jgi:hypothetical protein
MLQNIFIINFCVSAEDAKALTTSIYGIIAGVRVPFPITETDACKSSIKCPLSTGMTTTFAISILVDKSYPKVLYIYIIYKIYNQKLRSFLIVPLITGARRDYGLFGRKTINLSNSEKKGVGYCTVNQN